MKARTALIAIVAVIAAIPVAFILVHNQTEAANEAALQEQLRLARSEGIPTTWQEYGSQIRKVQAGENAAPIYKQLPPIAYGILGRIADTTKRLFTNPEPAALSYARQVLGDNAKTLVILDAGSKLPHCGFDWDWSKGLQAPQTNVFDVSRACRLLELRAALSAANGDHVKAVGDIDELATIARQIGEEGGDMPVLAAERAYSSAEYLAANLAFRFRNTDAYSKALGELIRQRLKPDVRRMKRDDLVTLFDLVSLSATPEGRKGLGLEESDVPPMESINPWLLSRTKARADIVRAERAIRQDLDLPYLQRKSQIAAQIWAIKRALAAYPSGLIAYLQLFQPDAAMWMPDLREEAGRVLYEAAYRALSLKQIPKTLKTDDLRSPYDGTSVTYSFDGKRITVSVSDPEVDGGSRTLKIPGEPAPAKPKAPKP